MKRVVLAVMLLFTVPCFAQDTGDGMVAPYVRYGSNPYSRYVTNPPKIYSGGHYMGELSENQYRPDSITNPYGRYGSRYSPYSVNNPYRRHSTQPIYVYPRW